MKYETFRVYLMITFSCTIKEIFAMQKFNITLHKRLYSLVLIIINKLNFCKLPLSHKTVRKDTS
jgi:hypothetical protein